MLAVFCLKSQFDVRLSLEALSELRRNMQQMGVSLRIWRERCGMKATSLILRY